MVPRHQLLRHGAVIGRSRSLGTRIHMIVPGSLTSYCGVPVTWAINDTMATYNQMCRNCIREMKKVSDLMTEKGPR